MILGNPEMQTSLGINFGTRQDNKETGALDVCVVQKKGQLVGSKTMVINLQILQKAEKFYNS
jgi:hypothetical protein